MPAPVLALGPVISWLAGAFASLLSGLIAWLAGSIAKRVAFFVLVAAAFTAITGTFMSAIINSLASSAIGAGGAPSAFYTFASWVIDFSTINVLFSVIVGVEISAFVAKWQIKMLDLKARL